MARQFSLPYQLPPVGLLPPAADAAGRTSEYVTLKNALKAWIVCRVNQGNAATVEFIPKQAQDVSGTGAKVLTGNVPIWLVDNTSSSDALVVQTAAANYTTDATLEDKIVIFEIEPEACMDMVNGFRTISITTGASNAANITEAHIHILGAYQGASQPSALTN